MLHREKLVLEFWDRGKELSIKNKEYRDFLHRLLSLMLKNDLKNGDLTTNSLIKKNKRVSAVIAAKENGFLAGLEEFKFLNKDLEIRQLKNDGDKIEKDEILIEIKGNFRTILERERTNLNLLQRMSGIATLTNKLAKKLKNARLAATRKTLWGGIDKKAVSSGGGLTHRLNLNDGILVKDNHLKTFNHDFEKVITLAKNSSKFVEIEVEDGKQALNAARAIKTAIGTSKSKNKNLFAIMLDNIKPKEIKSIIKEMKKQELYDYVLLEASGNINPSNFMEYANCGADVVSMGCITNSAKALNMSQEIAK